MTRTDKGPRDARWYLSLMSPNTKGEQFAWFDPTSLYINAAAFEDLTDDLMTDLEGLEFDVVGGLDAMGFVLGAAIAARRRVGFLPIRKAGKLPRAVHSVAYSLEYGEDRLEVHKDAFRAGAKVVIMDDLLATGGTAAAAASLVETAGAMVVGFSFLIELEGLTGREKLPADVPVMSLITY